MCMYKLTPGDLVEIKQETTQERTLKKDGLVARVTVHLGTCGIASGANRVLDLFKQAMRRSIFD